ncbi:MAG: hypothetical protein HYY13_00100 [Nitrospirae bacterium]|nr:hypothetical protein [Nitrospirota bacterium]
MPRLDRAAAVEAAAHHLSRRRFLLSGAVLAAAGAIPLRCARAPKDLRVPAGFTLKVLSAWEYALLIALARRMLGPRAAQLIDRRTVDPAAYLDETLSLVHPELHKPLHQAFAILEFSPWPILPKWERFTRSSTHVQDRVIQSLEGSRSEAKNAIYVACKLLTGPSFYAQPPSWVLPGYEGPPWQAPELQRQATMYPDTWPPPREPVVHPGTESREP